jgi:small subunit ribosomal protein S10
MKKLQSAPELLYITFTSTNHKILDAFVKKVKDTIGQLGLEVKGPIAFKTKRLRIATRYSPCGDGTETYKTHEMRIHKRLLICASDPRLMIQLRRLRVPKDVKIELSYKIAAR